VAWRPLAGSRFSPAGFQSFHRKLAGSPLSQVDELLHHLQKFPIRSNTLPCLGVLINPFFFGRDPSLRSGPAIELMPSVVVRFSQ